MSLPRKDARFYLDAEMHAALVAVCEARGVPLSDAEYALRVGPVAASELDLLADTIQALNP